VTDTKAHILVVDDEKSMREVLTIMLEKEGYVVGEAASGEEALDLVRQNGFNVMLTDLKMPGMSGLELTERVRSLDPNVVVITMTAFASLESAVEALRLGAFDYITKPFRVEEITNSVRQALEQDRLRRENLHLRRELAQTFDFSQIVGSSEQMEEIFDLVRKISATESTVLILGESGTGKELVARAIHYNSRRSDGRFVSINCGAIPETLLESELFGHRRGAFTGAVRDKEGLFSVARGGSFFLDEIGEMPASIQVKLLRALEQREIVPVGATSPIKVDTRVIAASNKDLEEEVAARRFRPDLFYRINVIPIVLPPLRERRDDIPLLVEHFLDKWCAKSGKARKKISPEALEMLIAYSWPGNVRELENLIQRAVTLEDSEVIDGAVFPDKVRRAGGEGINLAGMTRELTLEQLERVHILRTLERTGWHKKHTAEALGIDPSTLYRKLERFGISGPQDPGTGHPGA
jgi:two-component system response regulator PilR (NtrC family)